MMNSFIKMTWADKEITFKIITQAEQGNPENQ